MARQIETTTNAEARTLTFTFDNGTERTFDLRKIEDSGLLVVCALHGLRQKLADAAAISRDPETGATADTAAKVRAIDAVWASLEAGEWSRRATSGEATPTGLLRRALIRLYPERTPESIDAWLAGKSREEQAALRANPRIAPVIAEIKAESAKLGNVAKSDDLLAELEAPTDAE